LSFLGSVARSDVFLSNGAQVNVFASNGGSIAVTARNLEMTGRSYLLAGIERGLGSNTSKAGNISVNAIGAINLNNESAISDEVESEANGQGGDVNISASTLRLEDGAQVNTNTSGAGKAGSLSVDAQDVQIIGRNVDGQFVSALRTSAERNSTGDAGDLTIKTNTLLVQNGAKVVTDTFGAGNGGILSIDAQDVQIIGVSNGGFPGTISASAAPNSTGDSGDLTIKTNTLLVQNGAQVSASTFGMGNGGFLSIDAQDVQIIGTTPNGQFASVLTAVAEENSTGDAGDLTIKTNTLLVRDGAQIVSGTLGTGNAGFLSVDAQDVQIIGTTPNGQFPSGLFASADRTSTGNAGDLTLKTNTLLVRDGAQILTATLGAGNAGNLLVDAQDVQIIGSANRFSGLVAGALNSGDAGDLTIKTNTLLVRDGAGVIVESRGTGTAGNIILNARSIRLDNNAIFSADTRSALVDPNREQATININSQDLIITGNSNIRTNATGANVFGGNIRINTDNLVAVPNENNDISANSANFRGGNVTIRAIGILGIEFREQLTPLSDITATGASSELRGTVEINIQDPDPGRGAVQLPTEVVDATGAIATGCRGVQGSSFVVTGRGGLPPTPQQALGDDPRWRDWRTPAVVSRQPNVPANGTLAPSANPPSTKSARVEATGWVIEPDGKVILTASAPNATSPHRWGQPVNCNGS
jgi:large exoprotein involved in heme utilization and adhesion